MEILKRYFLKNEMYLLACHLEISDVNNSIISSYASFPKCFHLLQMEFNEHIFSLVRLLKLKTICQTGAVPCALSPSAQEAEAGRT